MPCRRYGAAVTPEQRDVSPRPRLSKRAKWTLAIIAALLFPFPGTNGLTNLIAEVGIGVSNWADSTVASQGDSAGADRLALISASCAPNAPSVYCDGVVRNISGRNMRSVQVVITWIDAAGTAQSADSAFLTYNPILAGQESPWKLIATYNPAFKQYRVSFKEFAGGSIGHRDDRTTK